MGAGTALADQPPGFEAHTTTSAGTAGEERPDEPVAGIRVAELAMEAGEGLGYNAAPPAGNAPSGLVLQISDVEIWTSSQAAGSRSWGTQRKRKPARQGSAQRVICGAVRRGA